MKTRIQKWMRLFILVFGIFVTFFFFLSLFFKFDLMIPIQTGPKNDGTVIFGDGKIYGGSNCYRLIDVWVYRGVFVYNSYPYYRSYGWDLDISQDIPKVLESIDNAKLINLPFYFRIESDSDQSRYYYFSIWFLTIILVILNILLFIKKKNKLKQGIKS